MISYDINEINLYYKSLTDAPQLKELMYVIMIWLELVTPSVWSSETSSTC